MTEKTVIEKNKKWSTRKKCAITLCCLFVLDIGPLPITALVGLSVICLRPYWFKNIVDRLYEGKPLQKN